MQFQTAYMIFDLTCQTLKFLLSSAYNPDMERLAREQPGLERRMLSFSREA